MKINRVLICLVGLMLSCLIIFSNYIMNKNHLTFNTDLWDKYPQVRYKMILSFEEKYLISNLTKSTVKSLLGEKSFSETENMYSYYIGDKGILGSYYALIFDESGKCVNRSIYSD